MNEMCCLPKQPLLPVRIPRLVQQTSLTMFPADPFDTGLRLCQADVIIVWCVSIDVLNHWCGPERTELFVCIRGQECLLVAVMAYQFIIDAKLLTKPDDRLGLTDA